MHIVHALLTVSLIAELWQKIQGKIVGKREQNLLSRLADAGNDKHIIAAWRLDPIRIIQAFDVRSAGSIRLLLTASLQTELALNFHLSSATVSLSWPIPTYVKGTIRLVPFQISPWQWPPAPNRTTDVYVQRCRVRRGLGIRQRR